MWKSVCYVRDIDCPLCPDCVTVVVYFDESIVARVRNNRVTVRESVSVSWPIEWDPVCRVDCPDRRPRSILFFELDDSVVLAICDQDTPVTEILRIVLVIEDSC